MTVRLLAAAVTLGGGPTARVGHGHRPARLPRHGARGIVPGLLSTALAAEPAVTRPTARVAPDRALPSRRLRSGHVGDRVAWPLVGAAPLGAPALSGVVGT